MQYFFKYFYHHQSTVNSLFCTFQYHMVALLQEVWLPEPLELQVGPPQNLATSQLLFSMLRKYFILIVFQLHEYILYKMHIFQTYWVILSGQWAPVCLYEQGKVMMEKCMPRSWLLVQTKNDFNLWMLVVFRAKKVNLSASKITQTNIPPRETVSYCKETQTPHEVHEREGKMGLGGFVSR